MELEKDKKYLYECDEKGYHPYAVYGVYYGYPECCIVNFINGKHLENKETNPFSGTGFLCCDDCREKGLEAIIKQINSQRFCDMEFKFSWLKTTDGILACSNFEWEWIYNDDVEPLIHEDDFDLIESYYLKKPFIMCLNGNLDMEKITRIHTKIDESSL